MLSAAQLLQLEGEVIFHQTLDKQVLRVFENTQYRWFRDKFNRILNIVGLP